MNKRTLVLSLALANSAALVPATSMAEVSANIGWSRGADVGLGLETDLGMGYGIFALDVAIGEWDGFGTPYDYTFADVLAGTAGDPWYLELGYAHSLENLGVDSSIAVTYSDDLVIGNPDDVVSNVEANADYALVFGIKKTIGIGEP